MQINCVLLTHSEFCPLDLKRMADYEDDGMDIEPGGADTEPTSSTQVTTGRKRFEVKKWSAGNSFLMQLRQNQHNNI